MNLRKGNGFAAKLSIFLIAYLIFAAVMYWVIKDDWTRTAVEDTTVSASILLPNNALVTQKQMAQMECIERISFVPHFYTTERSGNIKLSIASGEDLLLSQEIATESLGSGVANVIPLATPVYPPNEMPLTVTIDPQGTNMSMWAGNTVNAGKFDVQVATSGLMVDGEAADGELCLAFEGYNFSMGASFFWPVALVILLVSILLIAKENYHMQHGQRTFLTTLFVLCQKYSSLLGQLVYRDFRVKYKASTLGAVWSFLNPLLTMLVYLFVFSTIFQSDIEYFPVYLMSGIVLFNYFSESTSLGLSSIVGNSTLITKVYMPKVIYPLSRVLSSAINLGVSMIPLLLVMLVTGVPFTKSLLLLPFVILYLLVFSLGMSLILSTMNVFFRDTQFLWSVLLTLWNFLSPVFYPESIIPAQFITLYHMNPMYQILFFMRCIVIGGVSPNPITYLYCTLASGGVLLFGLWIFRKNQDKFVLHL